LTVYEAAVNPRSLTPLGVGARLFLGPGASKRDVREWWRGLTAVRVRLDTEAAVFCVDRAGSGNWECVPVGGGLMRGLLILLAHHDATANGRRAALIYKTTATKRYGLTPHQIDRAVESGLLRSAVQVKNPYRSSGPPALLVEEAELVEKLEAVRALPRRSEAEREWRRAVRCPVCGATIRPTRGRAVAPSAALTPAEARAAAVVSHFLRLHTAYYDVRQDQRFVMQHYLTLEEGARAARLWDLLRGGGLSRREERDAVAELNGLWYRALARAERAFVEEAIEGARKAGLLPEDYTAEHYYAAVRPPDPRADRRSAGRDQCPQARGDLAAGGVDQ